MNFCSDNVTGIAPEILDALAEADNGPAMPCGNDPITRHGTTDIVGICENGPISVVPCRAKVMPLPRASILFRPRIVRTAICP